MKKQDIAVLGMVLALIGGFALFTTECAVLSSFGAFETPTPTAEVELATRTLPPVPTFTAEPTEAPTPTPPPTPKATATPTAEPTPTVQALNPAEVELIGRTIWGEAGGVKSKAERAAVAWCILNRVDQRGQTIEQVVTAPHQFYGYRTWGECPQEHLDLAADVLTRWYAEKNGATDVGRTLPADYLYFLGDGQRNHFTQKWQSTDHWDWSLPNPYIN